MTEKQKDVNTHEEFKLKINEATNRHDAQLATQLIIQYKEYVDMALLKETCNAYQSKGEQFLVHDDSYCYSYKEYMEHKRDVLSNVLSSNVIYDGNSIIFWYYWLNNKIQIDEDLIKKDTIFNVEDIDIIKNVKQTFTQVTDVHGTLNSLLGSLLDKDIDKSPCKFVGYEHPIVFYDISKNKKISCIEEIENIKQFNFTNLVLIPNLEINPQFKGKWVFNGDLIDRGEQSESCICTIFNLLNQPNAEQKLIYLFGNHESLFMERPYALAKCLENQAKELNNINTTLFNIYKKTHKEKFANMYNVKEKFLNCVEQRMVFGCEQIYIREDNNCFFDYILGKTIYNYNIKQYTFIRNIDISNNYVAWVSSKRKYMMQQQYAKLIENNKILFSYVMDDVLFSHTMFEKDKIIDIINVYYSEQEPKIYQEYSTNNFNPELKNNFVDYINKISTLNDEQYKCLVEYISDILNNVLKFYTKYVNLIFESIKAQDKQLMAKINNKTLLDKLFTISCSYCFMHDDIADGLLWKRDDKGDFLENNNSFLKKQIIGHIVSEDFYPKIMVNRNTNDKNAYHDGKHVMYTDCGASYSTEQSGADYVTIIKTESEIIQKTMDKLLLSRQQLELLQLTDEMAVFKQPDEKQQLEK